MQHEPGSPNARLREAADHAWRLYCALEIEIPHRQSTSSGQEKMPSQRRSVAPIPWNSVAAGLTLEFHNKVRLFESELNARIVGSLKRRGSSDANTRRAIDAVVNLCTTSDEQTVLGVLNYLTGWNRRAENVFSPEHGLHRLPRQPGEGEARCPYCTFKTMRWNPAKGIAVCVKPDCTGADGQRPRWEATYTVLGGQLVFHWNEMEAA
jgi:hypothetical protein